MEIRKMKCPKCGYEWYCKSTRPYITCPYCYYKINTRKIRASQ